MKATQKKDDSTKLIELFHQLIPADATASETTTTISGAFLKLRYETAVSLKTDNPTLAQEEMARFLENCRIAAAVSLGIELRNYLLWEIYDTEQFRQTDQDFIAFGMRMTELSKPQLRKCVHAGRIRVAMILSDLDDVRPTGRQVEALSRIEEAHTVSAWLYALDYMRINGRSDATATEALMEYCKIKKIRFGKRMPNGSRKVSVQKALQNAKASETISKLEDKNTDDNWILNKHEQQIILGIDPDADMSITGPDLETRISEHIQAMQHLAASASDLSDYDSRQDEEMLALIMRKDEQAGRSLAILALRSLRKMILLEIRDRQGEHQKASKKA